MDGSIKRLKIREQQTPSPILQNVLNALFSVLVVTCFFLNFKYFEFYTFNEIKLIIPLVCIPFSLLFPISYIVLRLYGYKQINNMMISMFFTSISFIIITKIAFVISNYDLYVQENNITSTASSELGSIIRSTLYFYIPGLIIMPLSVYISFYVIKLFNFFNSFSLSVATAIGEIFNTYVVLPIGLYPHSIISHLTSTIIFSAAIFKVLIGVILSILTMLFLRIYE